MSAQSTETVKAQHPSFLSIHQPFGHWNTLCSGFSSPTSNCFSSRKGQCYLTAAVSAAPLISRVTSEVEGCGNELVSREYLLATLMAANSEPVRAVLLQPKKKQKPWAVGVWRCGCKTSEATQCGGEQGEGRRVRNLFGVITPRSYIWTFSGLGRRNGDLLSSRHRLGLTGVKSKG